MKTVTAIAPEPDPEPEPDGIDAKACRVLRYAYRKRIEAKNRRQLVRAAFWAGFHRSFRRRWYSH